VGIISTDAAIGNVMWITRQKPASGGINGGADGPASIFLAGKIGEKEEEIGRLHTWQQSYWNLAGTTGGRV